MTRTTTLQYHDKILILDAYDIGPQWDMFWAIALIPSTKDISPRGANKIGVLLRSALGIALQKTIASPKPKTSQIGINLESG